MGAKRLAGPHLDRNVTEGDCIAVRREHELHTIVSPSPGDFPAGCDLGAGYVRINADYTT